MPLQRPRGLLTRADQGSLGEHARQGRMPLFAILLQKPGQGLRVVDKRFHRHSLEDKRLPIGLGQRCTQNNQVDIRRDRAFVPHEGTSHKGRIGLRKPGRKDLPCNF